jgi:hypothetical protein
MNFASVAASSPGQAKPSLRNDPATAHYETNRRVIQLTKANALYNQHGHL